MPIVICIEVSEMAKKQLDEVVQVGAYRDYSEAISVAISNQLVLHRRTSETGSFVLADDSNSKAELPGRISEPLSTSSAKRHGGMPQAFALALAQECQINPAALPDDVYSNTSSVPIDRWFFGQHNKLLPLKASCRALANLLVERPLGIPISDAGSRISRDAALLGDFLRQMDARSGALREDMLSTAFPGTGEDSDKSRLRYANQFVASLNSQNQLTGLLADLKLVNLVRSKEPSLLLTDAGLKFAKLTNPVLDESMRSNGISHPRFSENEIQFLLDHISNRVPVENSAYRTVLSALVAGVSNPEALDEKLSKLLPTGIKKISDAFVTTQRSGVISRMSDLGMVLRKRDGTRVKYEATSRGLAYFNRPTGVHHES